MYTAGDGAAGPLSIYAIQRRLTADRVPSYDDLHGRPDRKQRGWGEWSRPAIGRILGDETYAGVWHGRAGSGTGAPAQAETIAVPVPAIVSRETWELAQARRAARAHLGRHAPAPARWLSGRLACGLCGATLGPPNRSVSAWTELSYYRCPAAADHRYHNYARPCAAPKFRVDVVDNLVWNWAQAALLDAAILQRGLAALRAERDAAQGPLRARLAAVQEQLAAQQAAAERLLDQYLAGAVTRDGLTAQTCALERAGLALAWERDQLAAQLAAPRLADAQLVQLQTFAAQVAEQLACAGADAELHRLVVAALDVQVTLTLTGAQKMITIRSVLGETTRPVPDPLVLPSHWWRSVGAARRTREEATP
jgi:site-specific DNA recombinase